MKEQAALTPLLGTSKYVAVCKDAAVVQIAFTCKNADVLSCIFMILFKLTSP